MSKIKSISLQEFRSVVFSPMFSIVALLCSTVWTYSFLRSVMAFVELSNLPPQYSQGPLSLHYQVIEGHISLVNLIFIFAIPAITMRLISNEKRNKTFELLLTSPVTSLQIALGKFLGGLMIASVLVAVALAFPFGLRLFAEFSLLPLLSTTIGLLFLTGMYVALGLFASSLSSSPVLSVILGIVFNLMLWLISQSTSVVSDPLWSEVLRQMSVPQQFYIFLKGTLNISATVFFVSAIGFFIFLCERIIESSRWGFGGLKMKKSAFIMWMISVISLGTLFVIRMVLGGWLDLLFIPLGLFIGSFILALILDLKYYLEFFKMKTARLKINMGALIVVSIVFVVAINFLSVRNNKSWDLTEEKLFTLSPKTQKVLETAKDKSIKILVFYRGIQDLQQKRQIQENFSLYSSQHSHVDVQFVDAYVDNVRAREYLKGLSQTNGPNVFVETESQRIRVTQPFTEQNMAIALIKATRDTKHRVLYITGHGERSFDPAMEDGIELFKAAMEDAGLSVEPFSFMESQEIPGGISAVVIAGPKQPYSDAEKSKLASYVKSGGRIFMAIDPGERHGLGQFTEQLGVKFKNNFVLNKTPRLQGRGIAGVIGLKFGEHPIVAEIAKQQTPYTLFDFASSLEEVTDAKYKLTPLVYSAATSFAVKDLSDAEKELREAHHTLAYAVEDIGTEDKESKGAAVVFGDSDFLSQKDFSFAFNRDLALGIMSHLLQENDLIQVEPKRVKSTQLILSDNQRTGIVVAGLTPPILFLCFAVGLWVRRKNS